MKKKGKEVLRQMSRDELMKQDTDLRNALTKLTVDRYTKQPKNTREQAAVRYKRAFVRTLLREENIREGTI